jgi:hypothetical protein
MERGKIKSPETVLRMSIWGCGSPALCFQPAVAGDFVYADMRSELNTHLALQAMFTQNSPGHDRHCYKFSPFQAHWERWHCTRFLRPACLFTVHVRGESSPLSCGVFLPLPLSQAFPLLGACPRSHQSLSSQAWLVYLHFWEGFSSPLFGAQGTPPSLLGVFIVLIVYYYFFLFHLVGDSLSRVLCLSGPQLSVGVPHTA